MIPPEEPFTNNAPDGQPLPPVEPPSARFILQLFLVPGILVAVVVAFVWLFFGWLGGGPREPAEFLAGLQNEQRQWQTAERLAQVLQRDDKLAGDVGFALDIAELLERELQKPPPAVSQLDSDKEAASDMARFLAMVVGRFHVPVGLPALRDMIESNQKIDDPGRRLRLLDAVWAVALLGERMKHYDELDAGQKGAILDALAHESSAPPKARTKPEWAKQAFDYLKYRDASEAVKARDRDPFGIATILKPCARCEDEMTRKATVMALVHWHEPGTEELLIELAGENDGLRYFENDDHDRGRREIRYNAARALAHRGSKDTPKGLLLETLDEANQRKLHPGNDAVVDHTLLATLQAVGQMKQARGSAWEVDPDLLAAVQTLAKSPNIKVQVEAKRLLGSVAADSPVAGIGPSREMLLIVGVGGGVILLLAIAVFARWQRQTATLNQQQGV